MDFQSDLGTTANPSTVRQVIQRADLLERLQKGVCSDREVAVNAQIYAVPFQTTNAKLKSDIA